MTISPSENSSSDNRFDRFEIRSENNSINIMASPETDYTTEINSDITKISNDDNLSISGFGGNFNDNEKKFNPKNSSVDNSYELNDKKNDKKTPKFCKILNFIPNLFSKCFISKKSNKIFNNIEIDNNFDEPVSHFTQNDDSEYEITQDSFIKTVPDTYIKIASLSPIDQPARPRSLSI